MVRISTPQSLRQYNDWYLDEEMPLDTVRIELKESDKRSAHDRVLWVTAEAVPLVKDMDSFLGSIRELVALLSKKETEHQFQNHESDLEAVRNIVADVSGEHKDVIFITPEKDRYQGILNGHTIVEVGISRVVNLPDWKTIKHRKNFPETVSNNGYKVFLDTISFTGRTAEQVSKIYCIDLVVLELVGRYAKNKFSGLGLKARCSRDVSDFDAVWHIDDFARSIETEEGSMKPSEFIRYCYRALKVCEDEGAFKAALRRYGIRSEQASPNLLLELSRPHSYLDRSLHSQVGRVEEALPLFEGIERVYSSEGIGGD